MPNLDRLSEAIQRELRRFVGESTGRSAAVQVLDIATKAPLRVDVAGDAVRPAASLLKLLPAIALYEAAAKGKVDLDQTAVGKPPI